MYASCIRYGPRRFELRFSLKRFSFEGIWKRKREISAPGSLYRLYRHPVPTCTILYHQPVPTCTKINFENDFLFQNINYRFVNYMRVQYSIRGGSSSIFRAAAVSPPRIPGFRDSENYFDSDICSVIFLAL